MNERIKMVKYIDFCSKSDLDIRTIDSSYTEELAEIMLSSYKQQSPDYEGEDFTDTVTELDNVFKGLYGDYMKEPSCLVLDEEGNVQSAIFVCLFRKEPTITYLFTKPGSTGKGYARALIKNAFCRLLDLGYDKIYLYVSTSNKPALGLYKSMGFVQIPINSSAIDRELLEEIIERELASLPLEDEKVLSE